MVSSNVEEFLSQVYQDKIIFELIDKFIIPIAPFKKQVVDSLKTIIELEELQIPIEKIQPIFNIADPNLTIEKQFEFDKIKKLNKKLIDNPIVILKNKIYTVDTLDNILKLKFDEEEFIKTKKENINKAREMALIKVRKQQANSLINEYKLIAKQIVG